MNRNSTVRATRTPSDAASSATGGLVVHAETLTVTTTDRVELVDLTDRVISVVSASAIKEGLASVWSIHTTCAVLINETQPALHADIKRFLEQAVSRDAKWLHNDPEHSDCDRMNADAHLRAMLLGHGLTLQISAHELVLGQWQRILAAELDGPRQRTIRVQCQGLA